MCKMKAKQLFIPVIALTLAGVLYGCGPDEETAFSYDERGETSEHDGKKQETNLGPEQRSKRTEVKGSDDQFTIMV